MLFKIALLEIRGKFTKSFILFLIFLVLFIGVLTSFTLLSSAMETKTSILEKIGASITLDYSDAAQTVESIFTADIIKKLSTVENVIGINQNYADFVMPLNFKNNKSYSGENPYLQEVQIENDPGFEDNIVFEGNIRTDLIDIFRNGSAHLLLGSYPTNKQPGAVISSVLAEQNKLNINDIITVSAYGKEMSINIIGIYETSAKFQITSDNIIGAAVFAYSPFNRIYVDIDSFETLFNMDKTTLPIHIYINSPTNVQVTGENIKSMDFDWNIFRLVNTTATEYSMLANSIEAIIKFTKAFTVLFVLVVSVVIIIVMSIWAETVQYESGIYLSLGASKWKAMRILLVATIFTAIPALIIAICTSEGLASLILYYRQCAIENTSDISNQFFTGIELGVNIILSKPNMDLYVFFIIVAIGMILLACSLPFYAVFKLKPKEILSKK